MFIVFLDIDGVLVTLETVRYRDGYPPAVDALNNLCQKYNASIVISSAWRKIHPLSYLQNKLHEWGVTAPVIGTTPKSCDWIRGTEILEWLEQHPECTDYVVIDDEVLGISDHIPAEKIIWVVGGLMNGGLNNKHVARWLLRRNLCQN